MKSFLVFLPAVLFGSVVVADDTARRPDKEQLRLLAEAINAIQSAYVDPVDSKALLEGAMRGMLEGLDSDSEYLGPKDWDDLQTGHLAGTGLGLGLHDGIPCVVSVIENSPAARAGMQVGDSILKIDDVDVFGLALKDMIRRLRGEPGGEIRISGINRQGARFSVAIRREFIKLPDVRGQRVQGEYAYIQLLQFSSTTPRELVRQMNALYAEGPLRGAVLDLRNNHGGLLNSAVGVAAIFLPHGVLIASSDGRLQDAKRSYRAIPEDFNDLRMQDDTWRSLPPGVKSLPMVVLVNGNSVAASEILAGALQDHKRARLLGSRTFGRSSIQSVLPLTQGRAIKLTTARWVTPNGRQIEGAGLVPDVFFAEGRESYRQGELATDRQLSEALRLLKGN